MPYDVYDGNGNKILQDQPTTFTVTNLSPLNTYSNYKVVDTVSGKSILLKPLQTSSKPATDVTTTEPILNLDVHNNPQMQITVQVSPQDTTDVTSFTTSNSAVATVSGSGLVSAVGNGSTYVTVLVGSKSTSVQINVTGG